MPVLKVKNWADFQHYKDRSPPWIKLHKGLLDNYEYHCLPDASKALAPFLWLIASESSDGEIDYCVEKLTFRLRITKEKLAEAVKPLIEHGFFEFIDDASNALADQLQDARLEEVETEVETEKSLPPTEVGETGKPVCPPCPIDEIIKVYHETLPTLPRMLVRNKTRDGYIRQRWQQFFQEGDFTDREGGLNCFRWYFTERVATSKFLTGQAQGGNGRRPFQADLEWLVRPSNFAKVLEGKYANGTH